MGGLARLGAIPTNAHCECAFLPVSAFDKGHLTCGIGAGPVEDVMGVAMFGSGEGLGMGVGLEAIVVMGHDGRGQDGDMD